MFNFDENTIIKLDEISGDVSYTDGKVCPKCGTALIEFLRSGVVGCANCYKVFESEIHNELIKTQGSINHIGKVSSKLVSKVKIREKIKQLEEEKSVAASEENFIVAEKLKNQIEKLKEEL
ncbi:MAG: hypothetical protein IJ538_04910 [Clostridia bacterium]|nr:hypothetical protein [Clostridia bacterium]